MYVESGIANCDFKSFPPRFLGENMENFEDFVNCSANWDAFLEYKLSGEHLSETEKKELIDYVENRLYLSEIKAFSDNEPFPDPVMKTLNKHNSKAKRTVFTFSENKNPQLSYSVLSL